MPHQLLLADDSVTIQRVIKLTFADEDVEVVTVGDGEQAVAAIDRQPPDIVLADVAMPKRSGYDVAEHIRTSPQLAHIPVLLLTGAFEPVDEARASAVGCDGVLAKPFEPDVVVSRVKDLLTKSRQAAASRTVAAPTATPAPQAPAIVFVPEPAYPSKSAAAPAAAPLVFPARTQAAPTAPVASAPSPAATPRPAGDVDAYFDRLDQAFATLAMSPRGTATTAPAPAPATSPSESVSVLSFATPTVVPAPKPAPTAVFTPDALADIFAGLTTAAAPAAAPVVVPPAVAAPVVAAAPDFFAATAPAPAAAMARVVAVAPAAAVAPVATPAAPNPLPAPAPVRAPQTAALSDAQLERIVTQVLERLTAQLGNPADVVANVAERLVRDEIAKIKSRL